MKVFLAGATGVVGTCLIPLLRSSGHEVVGMARSPSSAAALWQTGATVAVADALDSAAVVDAVCEHRPEVIIHHLTAIPAAINLKRLDDDFAATNRLRTDGTDNLLAAARVAGVRRVVAQSFAGWTYEPDGNEPRGEADPLLSRPPGASSRTLDALRHLEKGVTSAEGIDGLALRFGFFYGAGTSMGIGGSVVEAVRKRRLPMIGDGGGVWSFCHVDDAASATLAAVERGAPGVYNVADDDPAPVGAWLPSLADALGAKRPMRVPAWVGRLATGDVGVAWMTTNVGISNVNVKAKGDLGWEPRYPTWRDGFRFGLGT